MKQISAAFVGVALMLVAHAGDALTTSGGRMYSRLEKLQLVVLQHAVRAGRLPTTNEGLASVLRPDGRPYDTWFFADDWGEPFIYRAPSSSKERLFDLYSKGPNRKDDNGEEDDVVSWEYRRYYGGPSIGIFETAFMGAVILDGPILLLGIIGWYLYRRYRTRKERR